MARTGKIALQEQPVVAEGGACQALRRGEGRGNVAGRTHHLHSFPATARTGLDDERKPDSLRLRGQAPHILFSAVIAGGDGNAHPRHRGLRRAFR
jgi:hypothetical protein